MPRTVEAGAATVAVCAGHGAPVVSRGGGTSLAGQACNAAVVIDWTKYCHRLVSIDPAARTFVVEPGIVLDELNARLAPHQLMFGPQPATHHHCTLGGMIGNNSCGATAQAVRQDRGQRRRLEVLTGDGERFWVGPVSGEEYEAVVAAGGRRAEIYRRLRELAAENVTGSGSATRIPRRVSGYNLDSLLPENGFDVAQALVGSESTLVAVLHAELRLVRKPAAQALVVLGFPDSQRRRRHPGHRAAPARAAGGYRRTADRLRARAADEPRGPAAAAGRTRLAHGHLLRRQPGRGRRQGTGADRRPARHRARAGGQVLRRPEHEKELADVREVALGATARVPDMPDTWEGWEDSAVPPERLGDYLRDLAKLYDEFGYSGSALYGHFGQGCVHTRIPFNLVTTDGIATFRRFIERAADLVVSYGGSFSGEHGDGQSRGELLPKMFGEELVRAFGQFKAIFDPGNLMNPGKVVAPYRLDENLRLGASWSPRDYDSFFAYPDDDGRFERAVMRCVGVGKCRHDSGGVMCPSYMVTREEEHSTRGRAGCCSRCSRGTPTPRSPRAGAPPRSATRSTCAWPARAARRTARSRWTWPP